MKTKRKTLLLTLFAALLTWGGCSKDKGDEGVLTSPEALVGKWQLVRTVEHYKEDGKWHTDVEYDSEKVYYGDDRLYYDIYAADGTYRSEVYTKAGKLDRIRHGTWYYEQGKLYTGQSDPFTVRVLTRNKLVIRDHYDDSYDEDYFKRIE